MRYKFKLWDKREKKWETIRNIGLYEDGSVFYIQCWDETEQDIDPPYFMDNLGVDFELVQFTGLTDVNGVEIYEGDILRLLNSEVLCEVVYEAPSFCRRWINPKVSSLRGVEMESMAHNTYITYEVIGNIYQHKHLLKETN